MVYEPVELAQDLRTFDFMSPWEGANYVLPGDEKAEMPSPAPAPVATTPDTGGPAKVDIPKTTETKADTGAGEAANDAAAKKSPVRQSKVEAPDAPEPTEARPARKPRKTKGEGEK